jgi:hypothetical protein
LPGDGEDLWLDGVVRWLYGDDELISLDLNATDERSKRGAIKPNLLVIDFPQGWSCDDLVFAQFV